MKAAQIARTYLDYFAQKRAHVEVASASLLYNDPTLLFVNAGMVPFKPYFTGEETPPYPRAVSVQKCVRTLDIDEVGKTTRHGTFFQMLGNFSFGDYFKKEAIEWAWELVTSEPHNGGYGFDPAKIWVTVLGPGFHPDYPDGDAEARRFWRGVGVPDHQIQGRSLKDNYWSMGVPGPGGPCSEIYVDRGPEFGPDGGPEADEDRFLEIWNLVFQQEQLSAVRAKDDFDIVGPLPARGIDTGSGLERVAFLLQGKANMYEIDEVFPVIAAASEMSGRRYGADHDDDVRFRVLADHIRSALMLMTDGVTPGNEGRGYVLRRLLRRSVRAMRLLGVKEAVVPSLLEVSKEQMRITYPEIDREWARVQAAGAAEEETFLRTLSQGTQLFDTAVRSIKQESRSVLSGAEAFKLHDTYGFPIDLTLEMAEEQGLAVDREQFTALMAEQKARAKADARAKKGGATSLEAYRQLRDAGETPFLGYTELTVPTTVRGIITDGRVVASAAPGSIVEVVLAETPFYAESGGQDSDAGQLVTPAGTVEVIDVQRPVPGLVVHKVQVGDELSVGDNVEAIVDPVNRAGACQAHSATHIFHAALRELVGPTALQAGSYNKPGYLRFDFSATHGLSEELKREVEERANVAIRDSLAVTNSQLPLERAKQMGVMAMFGEKYPPIVRMVEMGGAWSRELCGGTHVDNSAQIGLLTLLGEQSIGSGTRRVEALVSLDAFHHMAAERALVSNLTTLLKVQPDQLAGRIDKLIGQLKDAERQIAELKTAGLMARADQLVTEAADHQGVALLTAELPDVSANDLRAFALDLRARFGDRPAVVALIGGPADKPALVVATNAQARERGLKAGALVGAGAGVLGGRGGGKDDLAQGGGTDRSAAASALREIGSLLDTTLRS